MDSWRQLRSAHYIAPLSILCALAILVVDLYVDRSFNLAVVYLLPISMSAWYVSRKFALGLAVMSAVAWLFLETVVQPPTPLPIAPYWNAFAMLVSFSLVTALLAQLKYRLDQAERRAAFDDLTQLPNRFAFRVLVEQELRRSHLAAKPLAMAYLDLDNFKSVNDHWGHATGDKVLQIVARTLLDTLRATDVVARLGGDEFVMMLPDTSREQAEPILDRLHKTIASVMQAEGWRVTGSLGVVIFDPPIFPSTKMIDAADRAMYSVKASGKNRVEYMTIHDEASA